MKKFGVVIFGLMFSSLAQAALIDREGGFIYDDVLDITWTQNAGLSGEALWETQVTWADELSIVDTVRGGVWDDWRMASMSVSGGVPTGSASSVVDCSSASELACQDNELGYMYYYNLGGDKGDSLLGDQGPFTNIVHDYWSGTENAGFTASAWFMGLGDGENGEDSKVGDPFFAWAVRTGDVGPPPGDVAPPPVTLPPEVPLPAAAWLFGSGLIGLIGVARRKKA